MTETTASAGASDQQKTSAALFGSVFNSGAEPVLQAQADLLASVETTLSGWLRRRHEAVRETQALVARLRGSSDPADFATAQQEWVSGAVRRLAADATAFQTAAQEIAERARGWFPNGAEIAASAASAATEATKAAGKTLRVANKAAE